MTKSNVSRRRPLVTVLPGPAIDGLDVSLRKAIAAGAKEEADGLALKDKEERCWRIGTAGRVHPLLVA